MTQAEIIMKVIVEPYRRIFGTMHPDLVDDLIEDLSDYPEDILAQAWKEVRRNISIKPKPAQILFECRKAANAGEAASQRRENKFLSEFEKKDAEILKAANEYVREFMQSPLFREAKAGGYAGEVLVYAQASAFFQAQVIGQAAVVSVDLMPLTDDNGRPNYFERKKIEDALRMQAATGRIEVQIPSEYLERWRELGEKRKRKGLDYENQKTV